MNKLFRIIISIVFLVMGLFCFIGGLGTLLNYYLQFYPGKISVEFESSLIYFFTGLILGILLFFLFYGLIKFKIWFLWMYGGVFIIWLILQFFLFTPFNSNQILEDIVFEIIFFVIPLLSGIYFYKNRKSFTS